MAIVPITVLLVLTPAGAPAQADRPPGAIHLRCRIDGGAWQPCQMLIESIGQHWWMVLGPRRFVFHHDGHGTVTMAEGRDPPRPVSTAWSSKGVLCWDGLCAEGPIPLD